GLQLDLVGGTLRRMRPAQARQPGARPEDEVPVLDAALAVAAELHLLPSGERFAVEEAFPLVVLPRRAARREEGRDHETRAHGIRPLCLSVLVPRAAPFAIMSASYHGRSRSFVRQGSVT